MNKTTTLLATAILFAQVLPAFAQRYNYSYGDSRVVNQNQTGLYMPSATYIGSGTLSRSAQGKQAGVGGSLPSVNMGSHVRTPGDNIYNNDGSERQSNGALIYHDQEQALQAAQRAKYIRAQRRMMMQQQQVQTGHFYVPGSASGGAASYGQASTAPSIQFRNGAATYGDNFGKGGGATRSF